MGRYRHIQPEQLIEFSKEHLYYEVAMLYGVAEHLQKDIKDFYIFNALLESFIIHMTIILDFFYKPQMKADDAKAIHYIRDVRAWKIKLPKMESYFRHFYRRRSKEVVHLSYRRLEIRGEAKRWDVTSNTKKIKRIVDLFLEAADTQLIHPNMYKLQFDA